MTIKVGFGKYTGSRSFRQWLKCVCIAAAFLVVALVFYAINSILDLPVDATLKLFSLIGIIFLLGTLLWMLVFVFPKAFHWLFEMMEIKVSKEENSPSQEEPTHKANEQTGAPKEEKKETEKPSAVQAEEESESEKLRREFRNRKL